MLPGCLRLRFGLAAALLVLATITASVWAFTGLARLTTVVSDTVTALTATMTDARARGRRDALDRGRGRDRQSGARA